MTGHLFAVLLPFLLIGCDQARPREASPGAPAEASSREPGEGGEPVLVIGRVLETPRPPHCGVSIYRVAVRYAVLRTLRGSVAEEEILVRQDCVEGERPEGDAGPIVVGDVHRLTLDPEPYRTARRVQWIPRRTDRGEFFD